MHNGSVEVVIIGSGVAGLAAAKTLLAHGVTTLVLESMARIGGRAHTAKTSTGILWDKGCHWLHSAPTNPLRTIADELGFRYQKHSPRRRIYSSGWFSNKDLKRVNRFIVECYERVWKTGSQGHDVSFSSLIPHASEWYLFFDAIVAEEFGINCSNASSLDHFRYQITEPNWPVEDGFGALIASYGATVPVLLSTPAYEVDWRGKAVKVKTPKGTITASVALVTASTGVLAERGIRFTPQLSPLKEESFWALPMGKANKIVFALNPDNKEVPVDTHCLLLGKEGEPISFVIRPFGKPIAIGHVGGRYAEMLEMNEREEMIKSVRSTLCSTFSSDLLSSKDLSQYTAWQSEPTIRGAYSAARPGYARAREILAEPVGEKIFFAGEATSTYEFSTVQGAYHTGITAAYKIITQLSRKSWNQVQQV